jgi:hypothetical protein
VTIRKRHFAVRYYRAPWLNPVTKREAVWYGEFDGRLACRQFASEGSEVLVAPHDVEYLVIDRYLGGVPLPEAAEIALGEFEPAWVAFAQPREHALAALGGGASRAGIHYSRVTLGPEYSGVPDRSPGIEYQEAVDGQMRRMFGIFGTQVLVAPFDRSFPLVAGNTPEGHAILIAQEIEHSLAYGVTLSPEEAEKEIFPDGNMEIEGYLEEAVTHAEFEAAWEQYALPRFAELAREY